jgi:hypothetical protein
MALQAIQAVSVSSTAPPPVWASAQRARLLGPKPNATCPRPRQTRPALDQRTDGERAERKDELMNHLLGRGVHIPRPAAANRGGTTTMEAAAISNPPSKSIIRIALVTGGNKGVGLETCRQLASRGLRVVLTARNEARGLEAVDGIRRSGAADSDVVFHQLDVTDAASVARLADFVRDQFGRLDILVWASLRDFGSSML